jgi:hypothetical protein
VADRLYLSCWIRSFGALSMLRTYEKLLTAFPFSKLRRTDSVFRIYAIEYAEPALLEVPIAAPVDVAAVMESAKDFQHPDACFEFDAAWDLWVFDQEWKLAPARVLLSCYGPEFSRDSDENLRIDFGLDEQFLPGPGGAQGMPMVRANIQSLLRLVRDLEERLRLERRLLWSESGRPFTELLEATLRDLG